MTHPLIDRLLAQRERNIMARKPPPWYAFVTKEERKFAETLTRDGHKLFGHNLVVGWDDPQVMHTYWIEAWL